MALSAESLDELIKPEDQDEWFIVKQTRFPRPSHKAYDKRTPGTFDLCYFTFCYSIYAITFGLKCIFPGLFKVEWTGDAFIGLNAKTYFCSGDTSKYSSKGVSHSCKLTFEDF